MNLFSHGKIDPQGLKIIEILQSQNFKTYLVGGCIRDLILNIKPKDFDIATSATPEQVRRALPHAYIIGKRFKLILARRKNAIFEISTFRKDGGLHKDLDESESLQKQINYNVFGTPKEDAFRRDFTLNALFYDPFDEGIVDYCGGLQHIRERTIHMIGDPFIRLKEDPIRILRAIRLAYKLDFLLDPVLREAIPVTVKDMAFSSIHRIRSEWVKLLQIHDPSLAFLELLNFEVLSVIAPELEKVFKKNKTNLTKFLKCFHDFPMDQESPLELFSAFILFVTRVGFQEDPDKDFKEDNLIKIMLEELGLFKYEQEFILRALKLLKNLKQKEVYQNDPQKKEELLKQKTFPIALFMAQRDPCLDSDVWSFWYEAYNKRPKFR